MLKHRSKVPVHCHLYIALVKNIGEQYLYGESIRYFYVVYVCLFSESGEAFTLDVDSYRELKTSWSTSLIQHIHVPNSIITAPPVVVQPISAPTPVPIYVPAPIIPLKDFACVRAASTWICAEPVIHTKPPNLNSSGGGMARILKTEVYRGCLQQAVMARALVFNSRDGGEVDYVRVRKMRNKRLALDIYGTRRNKVPQESHMVSEVWGFPNIEYPLFFVEIRIPY